MTNEESKAIEDIQGTSGFRIIQSLIENKLKDLDSVSDVDEINLVNVEAVFLGKKYAVKLLREFLNEIKLITPIDKSIRKTYE